MRTGGLSFFGGTARPGGSVDAEQRFYELITRWLGDGAYDIDDESKVRTRVMMVLGRMFATCENEAIKQAIESVPSTSIDQMDEWQEMLGMKYLAGVYGDTWLGQRFMAMFQRFTCSTPNIKRIANEVEKIMDAARPNGGLGVEGFENTRATAISDDGEKHFCILVPVTLDVGYGKWLIKKTQRPLYRAIKWALRCVSPAHTVPAVATTDIGIGAANRPAWYSDGYKGTAFSKDCVGS